MLKWRYCEDLYAACRLHRGGRTFAPLPIVGGSVGGRILTIVLFGLDRPLWVIGGASV